MIRPNELRIGNWLHLYDEADGKPLYSQVTGLTENEKIWFVKNPDDEECAWPCEKIKPIPLTEETIGWFWEIQTDSLSYNHVNCDWWYLSRHENEWYIFIGQDPVLKMEYVHIFQNWCKLTTGQELTIKEKDHE